MATSDLPSRDGIRWIVGGRLEAQDVTLKWYRAKIVDIKESKKQVMVHFDGWNSRWDDWFPMDSERLRSCSKIADWRDKKREKKSMLKVNQRVLARWKTLSMYPARITAVNNDGTYRVIFHDGIELNVSSSNVKSATADELNKIEKEIESRQWLVPQVAEGRRPRNPKKSDDSFIMTEPMFRRKSTEKGESSQERRSSGEKKPERKVKVETTSPAAILRQLKKKRKYLKLGEAIPDGSTEEKPSLSVKPVEASGTEATEESYDTFKASVSTKRKRTASHHSSGRTTPTEPQNQSTTELEDIDQSDGKSDTSPRKIKVKSTLHAKMARVREVCNKWKKEKEKKVVKKSLSPSHSPMLLSDSETSDLVPVSQEPLLATPSTSALAIATSTPLSVAIETGVSTPETVCRPEVSLTELDVDSNGQASPAISEMSHEMPITPATPITPITPATPITPITPITPTTPDPGNLDTRNKYPCTHCSRGFRKENLLNYHLKYYHSDETSVPLESVVPADELAIARKKPDPIKREDRKRSRDQEVSDHPRHPLSFKRRSEEGVRSGNMLFDTKRPSTGSYTTESDLDSSLNQPDLYSSSHFNLDFNTSDLSREIKQERRDSIALEESFVSDSEISIKTERERYDSFGVDSIVSEDQETESVAGEERREEVINCPCGFTEENGLMIQCEVCLCWQHVICIRLSEDKLPVKYICWVCSNPPGVRDSMKHIHDQDWLKEGQLTKFSYLARTRESMRRVPVLKALAGLVCDVENIRGVLTGLKKTAVIAGEESPELDSVYASLEAALAHGTVPQLPERLLTDGDRQECSMVSNEDCDDRADMKTGDTNTNTTTTTRGQTDQEGDKYSSAPGTNNIEGGVSSSNTTTNTPRENGDSIGIDPSETNGFSNESETPRPINGPSALSDHSYLQTGDRRNAVPFHNSHYSNHEVNSSRKEPSTDDVTFNEAQRNVNLYVSAQQDLIDERLDLLEQQVSSLEELDAGQPLHVEHDPLADVVGVKRGLRGLIQDLQKVKRMATYSVNRR